MAESGCAGTGFFLFADGANAVLDLCIGAALLRLGGPFAKVMGNAACLTADTADGAIVCKGKMPRAFAVVSTLVAFKVLAAVINVGRNALEAASVFAGRLAVIRIIVSVRGCAGAGLFLVAVFAEAVLDRIDIAILGCLDHKIAEAMRKAARFTANGADLAVGF